MSSSTAPIVTTYTTPVLLAEAAPWYALQTRSRHEKKVAAQLREKGITTYVPLIAKLHTWSDRRKLVHLPLFSCYVFVNAVLVPEVRFATFSTPGTLGFVSFNSQTVEIPAAEIEQVRKLLESNTPFAPHAFLKEGQRVRIRGGCLDGIEGILVGRQRERRLVISVGTIQRSLSISIEDYGVEPI